MSRDARVDWREAGRERYCGILLDRLETATTFVEREAISGRIEWLLGVPGAEDPDERALAVTVTRREIEIPDLLAWRRAFEAQHAGVPVADGRGRPAGCGPGVDEHGQPTGAWSPPLPAEEAPRS